MAEKRKRNSDKKDECAINHDGTANSTKDNKSTTAMEDFQKLFINAPPDLTNGDAADDEQSISSVSDYDSEVDLVDEEVTDSDDLAELRDDENTENSNGQHEKDDNIFVPKGPDYNEYEYDSSDEEELRNTVGDIPMKWYDDYPHIGYDLTGKKIMKPKQTDELDNHIARTEDPDYWRTVRDPMTGQNVVLSREDCEIIERMVTGKFAHKEVDPYPAWSTDFEKETMIHPLVNMQLPKASFIPSRWEKYKVGKMVAALKRGDAIPISERNKKAKELQEEQPKLYDLWVEDGDNRRMKYHIPAPKLTLPGHAESYNPPPEYLFNKQELEKWKSTEPEERKQNFVPQKFDCLRKVPGYSRFINERFERCLDLYLCPRMSKQRVNVNPDDLIPKLPQPRDLQPFPTTLAIVYKGHTDMVRKFSIDPTGQWIISGSDDHTCKLWEVNTGRCLKTIEFESKIVSVGWCPNPAVSLALIACNMDVYVMNPGLGDRKAVELTDEMIAEFTADEAKANQGKYDTWSAFDENSPEYKHQLLRLKISHFKPILQLSWHAKGDYMCITLAKAANKTVVIHQISRRSSQFPFTKAKGLVQCALFHPSKPFLFVATQQFIRIYNLTKQMLTKKLVANCKWISSMAIHPGGDNLIVGSYDCRLQWFDIDLSTRPYQTLRHQKRAIRNVDFHKKYPLFASTSDDGTVVVCHGMVYNDLMQNALIVPVKILRGHKTVKKLAAIDCEFHPTQPWLITSGSDCTIRMYA